VLRTFSTREASRSSWATQASATDKRELLDSVRQQVASAKQRLTAVMRAHPQQRAIILGLLASTEKREAQMRYHVEGSPSSELFQSLERARAHYWESYCLRRSQPSQLVQFLSLTLVLQNANRLPKPLGRSDQDTLSLWLTAEVQSLGDADSGTPGEQAWAYANLAELLLLVPLLDGLPAMRPNAAEGAVASARKVVSLAGASTFHVFSTRRQILRYLEWLNLFVPALETIAPTAEDILAVLPIVNEPEWDY
jgi:hypothetical protein